jgi:hypothetical protein
MQLAQQIRYQFAVLAEEMELTYYYDPMRGKAVEDLIWDGSCPERHTVALDDPLQLRSWDLWQQ